MSKTIRQRIGESVNDAAAMCFRRGLSSSESDMKPDKELIADMYDAKIRVQDLIEKIYLLGFPIDQEDDRIINFCIKQHLR